MSRHLAGLPGSINTPKFETIEKLLSNLSSSGCHLKLFYSSSAGQVIKILCAAGIAAPQLPFARVKYFDKFVCKTRSVFQRILTVNLGVRILGRLVRIVTIKIYRWIVDRTHKKASVVLVCVPPKSDLLHCSHWGFGFRGCFHQRKD